MLHSLLIKVKLAVVFFEARQGSKSYFFFLTKIALFSKKVIFPGLDYEGPKLALESSLKTVSLFST